MGIMKITQLANTLKKIANVYDEYPIEKNGMKMIPLSKTDVQALRQSSIKLLKLNAELDQANRIVERYYDR